MAAQDAHPDTLGLRLVQAPHLLQVLQIGQGRDDLGRCAPRKTFPRDAPAHATIAHLRPRNARRE